MSHAETPRGPAEVQLLGHRDEVTEVAKLRHENQDYAHSWKAKAAICDRFAARGIPSFAVADAAVG
jgi:hypothetical protein